MVRNVISRLHRALFGDDVFLSYARGDAADYALALASALTERKLSCFLDQWGTPPGTSIPQAVREAAGASRLFVVLVSELAADSLNVGEEVEEFCRTGRPIIPVVFSDRNTPAPIQYLHRARWGHLIQGVSITVESAEALPLGLPSDRVIGRIVNAEGFVSRNRRLRQISVATLAVVLSLLAIGAVGLKWQTNAANVAIAERATAESLERAAMARRLGIESTLAAATSQPLAALLAAEAASTLQVGDPRVPSVDNALRSSLSIIGGSTVARLPRPARSIAFSRDGRFLAATSDDGTIHVWDRTSAPLGSKTRVLKTDGIELLEVALSGDNRWVLAYGQRDDAVWLWDLAATPDKPIVIKFDGSIQRAGFSANSRWAVVVTLEGSIVSLWELGANLGKDKIILGAKLPDDFATDFGSQMKYMLSNGVAITDDWQFVVSSGSDRPATLWDLSLDDPRQASIELPGRVGQITHVSISARHRWLAVHNSSEVLPRAYLWELRGRHAVGGAQRLNGHTGTILSMSFSPDERWLATGSADRTALLRDLSVPTKERPLVLKGHAGNVAHLAFSPDGRWLATGSHSQEELGGDDTGKYPLQVWNLKPNVSASAFGPAETPAARPWSPGARGRRGRVLRLAFSSNSAWLVTNWATIDKGTNAYLYRLPPNHEILLQGHEGAIADESFSPDSESLATASEDGSIRIWDVQAPQVVAHPQIIDPHQGLASFRVGADPTAVVVTGSHGPVRLLRINSSGIRSSEVLPEPGASVGSIGLSASGRFLITAIARSGRAPQIVVYDLSSNRPFDSPVSTVTSPAGVEETSIARGDVWAVARLADRRVCLWRLAEQDAACLIFGGIDAPIDVARITTDQEWLVTTARGQYAPRLWRLRNGPGSLPLILNGHSADLVELATSGDGRWIATSGRDKSIRLWDLRAADPATASRVLTGHKGVVNHLVFTPNSLRLISYATDWADSDPGVFVWKIDSEEPLKPMILKTWQGNSGAEDILAVVSANSQWLLTSAYQGSPNLTTTLWDLTSAETALRPTYLSAEGTSRRAAFSKDGRWVTTGVFLWELLEPNPDRTRTRLPLIAGQVNATVNSVAFSTDGEWVIVASASRVLFHSTNTRGLIDVARRAAARDLTTAERDLYGIPARSKTQPVPK